MDGWMDGESPVRTVAACAVGYEAQRKRGGDG
jgi:hypothetical protein